MNTSEGVVIEDGELTIHVRKATKVTKQLILALNTYACWQKPAKVHAAAAVPGHNSDIAQVELHCTARIIHPELYHLP